MAALLLLLAAAMAYLAWTVFCLERNARTARALKVPFVRIPFSVNSYAWVIVQPLVWKLLRLVPVDWRAYPDFVRYSHRNWQFLEKSRPTADLGPAWALVSPDGVTLHFADPDAIEDIFSRWRDFVRPIRKYAMLEIYGPSVFTVGLDDWPRHRKAVVAPFNSRLMRLVWHETLRHTQTTVQSWSKQPGARIPSLDSDLRELTFNVLGATAFSDHTNTKRFVGRCRDGPSYRDALQSVLDNAILLMLVPYRYLLGSHVPARLSRIGYAAAAFKSILLQALAEEMDSIDDIQTQRGGLLTPLVRALIPSEDDGAYNANGESGGESAVYPTSSARARRAGLSVDEMLGNGFVINFAGHDTVLLTLNFAMTMLAAHPHVQAWLQQEIAGASMGEPPDAWDYNDLFPKLKRCRAVFLETLRVFAPITAIPKLASDKAPTIHVGDEILPIPPGIEVFPLLLGVQTDPRYWKDPYEWRPSRWILQDGSVGGGGAGGEQDELRAREELLVPRRGTFFPWSDGPQNCVGKLFSQVEGVAVLACLFHSHCLRVEARPGETPDQANDRARACANDVNYDLLLRMNSPKSIRLQCFSANACSSED